MTRAPLRWSGIVRLGLVQTALGAIVVLTTSTLNRIMVVELQLAAALPGLLVGLHYAAQIARPRWGHGCDASGRRTPWIAGGMTALAAGGFLAALATVWMASAPVAGFMLAAAAFVLIGGGVGAAGTALLALLAARVAPGRRAAAGMLVWIMMLIGFILTAGLAGQALDPFSPPRLLAVAGTVSAAALLLALLAMRGVESGTPDIPTETTAPPVSFHAALAEVWAEPEARRFTLFVLVSMLAYSTQDLILEPFAGTVFGFTPGASTQLAGVQHGGVLAGMLLAGAAGSVTGGGQPAALRAWSLGGCLGSAIALAFLAVGAHAAPDWPLSASVFLLGLANGTFAVGAIGSMMALAGRGRHGRGGVRMGLWGAAQAIAFGLGGFLGAAAVDIARALGGDAPSAYAAVFMAEAALFVAAGGLALGVGRDAPVADHVAPDIGDAGGAMLPAGTGDAR